MDFVLILDEARQTWPGLGVDEQAFERWLEPKLVDDRLCTRDLYLAYACISRNDKAFAAFDRDILSAAREALVRMNLDGAALGDLLQAVQLRVLIGDAKPPRSHDYAGRGDLRSWVRVIATRLAIDLKREQRREMLVPEPSDDALGATRDPELDYLRTRNAAVFAEAFAKAAAALSPDARNVLRFHYIERLSIDAIGAILGIHRVTAARRIAAARDFLVGGVKAQFAAALGATPSQMSSEMRALGSAAHISLARVLHDEPQS